MLSSFLFTNAFKRFCQSGFYIDFFVKKIVEIFIRNVFVYTSQFFGEKYFIEVLTKKAVDKCVFNNNKTLNNTRLFIQVFFIQIISFIFLATSFIIVICLFL